MEYLTTYYKRQGEHGCSLLLQHYLCGQVPVCFAALCTSEGGRGGEVCREATARLMGWCRSVPWHSAAKKTDVWLRHREKELEERLEYSGEEAPYEDRPPRDGEAVRATLLLGVGEEILVLGGGQNVRLLSTSFGRGRVRELPGQFRGSLETGAGILLATDEFLRSVEEDKMAETLHLPEIRTEEQAERRLKELAVHDRAGTDPAAAILLAGREEEFCG